MSAKELALLEMMATISTHVCGKNKGAALIGTMRAAGLRIVWGEDLEAIRRAAEIVECAGHEQSDLIALTAALRSIVEGKGS